MTTETDYHTRTIKTVVDGVTLVSIIVLESSKNNVVGIASLELEADTSWFKELYIDKKHRRKGLASMICLRAISLSTSHRKKAISLSVRRRNTEAIQLYKKLGFTVCWDYGDGNWMMSLKTEPRAELSSEHGGAHA